MGKMLIHSFFLPISSNSQAVSNKCWALQFKSIIKFPLSKRNLVIWTISFGCLFTLIQYFHFMKANSRSTGKKTL